jgi:hypothetical protein
MKEEQTLLQNFNFKLILLLIVLLGALGSLFKDIIGSNIINDISIFGIFAIPITVLVYTRIKKKIRQKKSFLVALSHFNELSFPNLEVAIKVSKPIIIGWNKCYFIDKYLLNWTTYEIIKIDSVIQATKTHKRKQGTGYFPLSLMVIGWSFRNCLILLDSYGNKLNLQTEWSDVSRPSIRIGDESLRLNEMIEAIRLNGSNFETTGEYHENTFQQIVE